jgi:mannose-6-phosphate isomerase
MSTQFIYPLTFTPQLRDYVWGGRNLETLYNRKLPPGIIAESWEISGHPHASTVVDYGPLAGQTLPQVLAQLEEALVGQHAPWALQRHKFPLLIKLLDANQNLSVQVHPDDAYALANENGELGKTEMWYVLHAQPGAKIIFGLKPNVTPESFRQALAGGTVEELLHYLPVQAGDAILVEARSVHALLEGVIVAEVQQNSDITYRVYDWGRLGTDGKPRELHIDKALAVINFEQVEPGPYQPQVVFSQAGLSRAEISRCDYFVVEKVVLEAGVTYHGCTDGSSLEIWGTVEGQGQLIWEGETVDLPAIRFVLIPATLGNFVIAADRRCVMLRVYLP